MALSAISRGLRKINFGVLVPYRLSFFYFWGVGCMRLSISCAKKCVKWEIRFAFAAKASIE